MHGDSTLIFKGVWEKGGSENYLKIVGKMGKIWKKKFIMSQWDLKLTGKADGSQDGTAS